MAWPCAAGRTGTPLFVFAALVLFLILFGFRSLLLADLATVRWSDTLATPSEPGNATPGEPAPETSPAADVNSSVVQGPPALPSEYSLANPSWISAPLSDFCQGRYTAAYLEGFREHRAQYCSEASQSRLTCFHTPSAGSIFAASLAGSNDSLCIAQHGMFFDTKRQKFALDCDSRQSTGHRTTPETIPLAKLNSYQYLTGPKYLLKQWLDLSAAREPEPLPRGHSSETGQPSTGKSFVLLLKREVDGNIFHNMNEIMAIMITLDVLRMTPDPTSTAGAALFSPEDIANTQIVILDEHPDGPLFNLFSMFSRKKPLRVDEWIASAQATADAETGAIPVDNVILPLAGAANNLWVDFNALDCEENEMLRVFVQRVFDLFGIPRRRPAAPSSPAPRLNVTLVHRRSSRKLMGLDSFLLDAARARFAGDADIHLVDFAALTLQEQIQVSRDTDVLVGMHGAGLTQAMFMEEGRGVVVEIQPDRMCYKGFENLARMGGRTYIAAGANKIVGNCYDDGEEDGRLEMLPDGGTISAVPLSRCYSSAPDPDAWSFTCSDTALTGGDQSYMICRHRDENDDWYKTCEGMEAGDIWWIARYVMKQERFLEVLGQAIDTVRKQQRQGGDSLQSR